MRILIYTGKGGVGKTSIAAATALRVAGEGKRVIVMSTDQAHSLRDSFGLDSGHSGEMVAVRDNLDLLEINTVEESRKAWGSLQDYLRQVISQKAQGGLAAEEALIFPGFEELFALLRILDLYESGRYDVMIVDCAPTGETLALLRYPERLRVIADKILPMVRNVNKAFGSFISRRTTVPKPRDAVFEEFDRLIRRLDCLRKVLQDRAVTSLRIVMSPERIVIEEGRRSYTWIQLYDFSVDAVYVNRLFPQEALQGYFEGWDRMQKESLTLVAESFPNQQIFHLTMQNEEILGSAMLEKIGEKLYHGMDPTEIYYSGQAFHIEDQDGTRVFVIDLPYAKAEELHVEKKEKELLLTFRNENRRFRLPDKLVRRYISSWEYGDGKLQIFMDYE